MSERPLLIGQLAKLAGVKPDTVRFYERSGLLPKPARTASEYRLYDEATVNQLRFIKKAQSLGFSLDEVRRILCLRGQGSRTCRSVIAIAEATLEETEIKLRELQKHNPIIGEVRGLGLMIGVELVRDEKLTPATSEAEGLRDSLLKQGLLVGVGGVYGNVVRFQPPLIISKQQIDQAINLFATSLQEVSQAAAV